MAIGTTLDYSYSCEQSLSTLLSDRHIIASVVNVLLQVHLIRLIHLALA